MRRGMAGSCWRSRGDYHLPQGSDYADRAEVLPGVRGAFDGSRQSPILELDHGLGEILQILDTFGDGQYESRGFGVVGKALIFLEFASVAVPTLRHGRRREERAG